jgi:dienelactone hydrolase
MMKISFTCPSCGKQFSASDEFAGKKVRCKQCSATTTVPAAPSSKAQALAQEPGPDDPYGLADNEPMLPPRMAEPTLPLRESVPTPPSPGKKPKVRKKPEKSGASGIQSKGIFGGSFVLVLLAVRIILRLNRGHHANDAADQGAPPPPSPSIVATAAVGPPSFPARGEGSAIRPGVRFFEARASGPPTVATMNMTVWAYLPDGAHQPRSLPCVIIAPAGSITITGMDLGDGDRAEHCPYIPAGYALLAYSLDGHVDNVKNLGDARLASACAQFVAARAGLANAKAAIDWMLKNFPEVDPERLYTAGHSSAGTSALLLAENDARIKACAAFAPRSNSEGNFNALMRATLRRVIPNVDEIFTSYNPLKQVSEMKCPVFLFQARDDSVIPVSETEAFASALQSAGKDVSVELVPSGGHYDPMVTQGIPRAIAFFAAHGSRATGTSAPASGPQAAARRSLPNR